MIYYSVKTFVRETYIAGIIARPPPILTLVLQKARFSEDNREKEEMLTLNLDVCVTECYNYSADF